MGSDKRDAIFEAALELFADRGFHGTTVPAIAELAGVGTGTIYRYFESKEILVNELYRLLKGHMVSELTHTMTERLPPRKQFSRLWNKMLALAIDHPRAFRFLEMHHHASYLDDESRELKARLVDVVARLIVSFQQDGSLRPGNPHVLMCLIHWGLVGLMQGSSESQFPLDRHTLDLAEEALWSAIRSPDLD